MRKREEIINDPKNYDLLILETLLDIRDLLQKKNGAKRRGRPRKIKA